MEAERKALWVGHGHFRCRGGRPRGGPQGFWQRPRVGPPVRASVLLSNYNPKGNLVPCLVSLLEQDPPAEVVFVLHGAVSPAELRVVQDLARRERRLRILGDGSAGRPEALDAAVAAASGDLLVFVESHCLAPPGLVAGWLEATRTHPDALLHGPRKDRADPGPVPAFESRFTASVARANRQAGRRQHEFSFHNTALPRGLARRLGPFQGDLPNLCEVAWAGRAADAGVPILEKGPTITHVNDARLDALLRIHEVRAREAGRLWHDDPAFAARHLPARALERHGALIRRLRWPLVAALTGQRLATIAAYAAARALRWSTLAETCATSALHATVRRGVLRGLGE